MQGSASCCFDIFHISQTLALVYDISFQSCLGEEKVGSVLYELQNVWLTRLKAPSNHKEESLFFFFFFTKASSVPKCNLSCRL